MNQKSVTVGIKLLHRRDLYSFVFHSHYIKHCPQSRLLMNPLGRVCVFLEAVCWRIGQRRSQSLVAVCGSCAVITPPLRCYLIPPIHHSPCPKNACLSSCVFRSACMFFCMCLLVGLQNSPFHQRHRAFVYNDMIVTG